MRRAWFGCVIFYALAVTLGCREPSADWNGTCKLNLSKSDYQRLVVTISILADGEYRYDAGVRVSLFAVMGRINR